MNFGENERNHSPNSLTMKNETRCFIGMSNSRQRNNPSVASLLPHMLKCFQNSPAAAAAGLFPPMRTPDSVSSTIPSGLPDEVTFPEINEAKPDADGQLEKQMFIRRLLEMASSAPGLLPFLTFPLPPPQMQTMGQLPIQHLDISGSQFPSATQSCNGLENAANLLEKYASHPNLVDTAATSMTMTSGTPIAALATSTSIVTPTKEAVSMDDSSSPEANSILNASIPALGLNIQMNDIDKAMIDKSLEQAGSLQQITSLLQLQNMSGMPPPFFFPLLAPPTPALPTVTSMSQTFTTPSSSSCYGNTSSNSNGQFISESARVKTTIGGQSGSGHKTEDDFCELCQKHFCNKYYLRKHKADVHGIYTEPHSHARRREAVAQSNVSYLTGGKSSMTSSGQHRPTFSSGVESTPLMLDVPAKMDVDEMLPIVSHRNDTSSVGNSAPTTLHLPSVVKPASAWTQQLEMSARYPTNQSSSEKGCNDNQYPSSILPANGTQVSDVNAIRNIGSGFPFAPILGIPTTHSASAGPIGSFDSMLSAQYCMLALTGSLPQGIGNELLPPFGQRKGWNASKTIDPDNNPLFQLPDLSRSPTGIHEVKCDQCQKIFCNQYFLQVHRANHHGGESDQDGVQKDLISKFNSLDNRSGSNMVRQMNIENPQVSNIFQITPTDENIHKEIKSIMSDANNSLPSADTLGCQDYKPGVGASHTMLNKSVPSTREASLSATEFKANSTTSLDAFKTSMVAAKLADRVTCDLCKKELCNKYFLRTHKIRVHGISPRDVGGPPMRNPPVVTSSHNPTYLVPPATSATSSKAMATGVFDYSSKECKATSTYGQQVPSTSQFLAYKQNIIASDESANTASQANVPDFTSLPVDPLASLPPSLYPFPYVPLIPQFFQATASSSNSTTLPSTTATLSTQNELAPTNLLKLPMDTTCNSMASLPCPTMQPPWFTAMGNEPVPSIGSLLPGNGSSVYCPLCEHSVGPRFLLPAHLTSVHGLSPTETSFFLYLLQAKPVLPACSESAATATSSCQLAQTTTTTTTCVASELRGQSGQPGTGVRTGEPGGSMDQTKLAAKGCVVCCEPAGKSEPSLFTGTDQAVTAKTEECGTKDVLYNEESLNLQTLSRTYEGHQTNSGWKNEFYSDMQESLAQSLRSMIKTKTESHQPTTTSNLNPLDISALQVYTESADQTTMKPETTMLETKPQVPYLPPMPAGLQGSIPPTNLGIQPASLPLAASVSFMGLPMCKMEGFPMASEQVTPADPRSSDEFSNDTGNDKSSPGLLTSSALATASSCSGGGGGVPWSPVLPNLNSVTAPMSCTSQSISPVQAMATGSSNVSPLAPSMNAAAGGILTRKSPNQMRVLCDICNKWICNKYFLRTHKANKHGINEASQQFASSLDGNYKFNATNQPSGQRYQCQPSQIHNFSQFQALNCVVSSGERDNQEMNVDSSVNRHQDGYSAATSEPFNQALYALPSGLGDNRSWLNRFDTQMLFPPLQRVINDPTVMDHLTALWNNKISEVGNQLGSEVNDREGLQPPMHHQQLPFFPFGVGGSFFLPGTSFPVGSAIVPASASTGSNTSLGPAAQSDSRNRFTSQDILSSMGIFGETSKALDLCQKSHMMGTKTDDGSTFSREEEAATQCEINESSRAPRNLSFNYCDSMKHSKMTYSRPHKKKRERLIYLALNYLRRAKKHHSVKSNVPHFIHKSKWRLRQTKDLTESTFGNESGARWRMEKRLNNKGVNQFASSSTCRLLSRKVSSQRPLFHDSLNNHRESMSHEGQVYSAHDDNAASKADSDQHFLQATIHKRNSTSTAAETIRHQGQPHSFQISQLARSSRDLEAADQSVWFSNEKTAAVTSTPGLSTKEANTHDPSANGLAHRPLLMPLKVYRETLSSTM